MCTVIGIMGLKCIKCIKFEFLDSLRVDIKFQIMSI